MRKWITPLQVTIHMHVPHVILWLKFRILAILLTRCVPSLPPAAAGRGGLQYLYVSVPIFGEQPGGIYGVQPGQRHGS